MLCSKTCIQVLDRFGTKGLRSPVNCAIAKHFMD